MSSNNIKKWMKHCVITHTQSIHSSLFFHETMDFRILYTAVITLITCKEHNTCISNTKDSQIHSLSNPSNCSVPHAAFNTHSFFFCVFFWFWYFSHYWTEYSQFKFRNISEWFACIILHGGFSVKLSSYLITKTPFIPLLILPFKINLNELASFFECWSRRSLAFDWNLIITSLNRMQFWWNRAGKTYIIISANRNVLI